MPFTPHPTLATGSTFTADNWNTYVKGNLDVLFPFTSSLQVAYSDSTESIDVATSTLPFQAFRSNLSNNSLEFGAMVLARQVATVSSTTNYSTLNLIIQVGKYTNPSTYANSTRSFPQPFTATPTILIQSSLYYPTLYSVTSTGFIAGTSFSDTWFWIAIGSI